MAKTVFTTKKAHHNIYFYIISIVLVLLLGFLIFRAIIFFVKNTDNILSNNAGSLEKKKEFNIQSFEEIKQKIKNKGSLIK